MNLNEALSWLRGERSTHNMMLNVCSDPERRAEVLALIAQSDAAHTQQAYCIIKAAAYTQQAYQLLKAENQRIDELEATIEQLKLSRDQARAELEQQDQEVSKTQADAVLRTSAMKQAKFVLENWDQYKKCYCAEVAQYGQCCELHVALRLLRSALKDDA